MNKNLILILILISLFLLQFNKREKMSNDRNNYLDTACINCLNESDCDSKQIGNCTYICRLGTATETEFRQHIDDTVCFNEIHGIPVNKESKNKAEKIKKDMENIYPHVIEQAACINCLNGSDCESKQIGNCTYICRLGSVTEEEFMQQIDNTVCVNEKNAKKNRIKKNVKNIFNMSVKKNAKLKKAKDVLDAELKKIKDGLDAR